MQELDAFRQMPSFGRVIDCAGRATTEEGKRFGHQRRIKATSIRNAARAVSSAAPRLLNCRSFEELHAAILQACERIPGIGELYIYDTALRIGAFLGKLPEYVYLHRGTRAGAKALGLDVSQPFLRVEDLPDSVRTLEPHEIEDFLCIYKRHFKR